MLALATAVAIAISAGLVVDRPDQFEVAFGLRILRDGTGVDPRRRGAERSGAMRGVRVRRCRASTRAVGRPRLSRGGPRRREAGPPVVLLHGFPESSRMWVPLMAALGRPGGAASPPTSTGSASPPTRARRRSSAASRRSPRSSTARAGRVALVVHDWGGFVGLAWACEHPERRRGAGDQRHRLLQRRALARDGGGDPRRARRGDRRGDRSRRVRRLLRSIGDAFDEEDVEAYWRPFERAAGGRRRSTSTARWTSRSSSPSRASSRSSACRRCCSGGPTTRSPRLRAPGASSARSPARSWSRSRASAISSSTSSRAQRRGGHHLPRRPLVDRRLERREANCLTSRSLTSGRLGAAHAES